LQPQGLYRCQQPLAKTPHFFVRPIVTPFQCSAQRQSRIDQNSTVRPAGNQMLDRTRGGDQFDDLAEGVF